MERALLLDTDRVRFDEEVGYDLSPGSSTAEAVRHGIALAQVGAVSMVLEKEPAKLTTVLFCGGGSEILKGLFDGPGDYCPDLVFEGLEMLNSSQ